MGSLAEVAALVAVSRLGCHSNHGESEVEPIIHLRLPHMNDGISEFTWIPASVQETAHVDVVDGDVAVRQTDAHRRRLDPDDLQMSAVDGEFREFPFIALV